MSYVIVQCFFVVGDGDHRYLHVLTHSSPTRRSSDLTPNHPPTPHHSASSGSPSHACASGGSLARGAASCTTAVPAARSCSARRSGRSSTSAWPMLKIGRAHV